MEACAGAHHWGRQLQEIGHEVRLMPPSYVKPCVKRGKTDAADAAAICEAVTRPSMRFVAVKSEAASAVIVLHRVRDFLVRQVTRTGEAIRAHMAELGSVAAKGGKGRRGAGPGARYLAGGRPPADRGAPRSAGGYQGAGRPADG